MSIRNAIMMFNITNRITDIGKNSRQILFNAASNGREDLFNGFTTRCEIDGGDGIVYKFHFTASSDKSNYLTSVRRGSMAYHLAVKTLDDYQLYVNRSYIYSEDMYIFGGSPVLYLGNNRSESLSLCQEHYDQLKNEKDLDSLDFVLSLSYNENIIDKLCYHTLISKKEIENRVKNSPIYYFRPLWDESHYDKLMRTLDITERQMEEFK